MIYDLIIIGAGASGLFAGASLPSSINGLIIEKNVAPGRKLLMSGSGQCNLTHAGSIKDFISHYGENGKLIRPILYSFNNQFVIDFFKQHGIPLFEREDGKVFPKSLQAQEILSLLVERCLLNGLRFCYSTSIEHITYESFEGEIVFRLQCGNITFSAKKVIVATGGCSYPLTGSDGNFYSVLREMGLAINTLSPSLVPIYVEQYPYQELAGISFQNAKVTIASKQNIDGLLLTHTGFSGPSILNLSRYAQPGDAISINYYPEKSEESIIGELLKTAIGNNKQLLTVLSEYFNQGLFEPNIRMPKRFLEALLLRTGIDATLKSSRLSPTELKLIIKLITNDKYKIQSIGGYQSAMVTSGGVSLAEINTKSMEAKQYPNLYFAGEVLDVDGDTGGYNLQFAFSSGFIAAQQIII